MNREYVNELAADARRDVLRALDVPALEAIIMQYRITIPSLKNWKLDAERKRKFKKELIDLIIFQEYGL